MKELIELTFPPEAEEMAIKYAAFDIMKQLNKEGKITDEELRYIAKKRTFLMRCYRKYGRIKNSMMRTGKLMIQCLIIEGD